MKRQELRVCLDRIQPREQLIRSTLDQIHAVQAGKRSARAASGYAFGMRLAGAACALLLLIGVAMSLDMDVITAPVQQPAASERVSPMTADAMVGVEETPVASEDEVVVGCEDMIVRATAYETDYAVMVAAAEALYFPNASEGIVSFRPISVVDHRGGDEALDPATETSTVIAACIDLNDAALLAVLSDAVGGEVLVGIHVETRNGETVWVVHEMYLQESVVD